MGKVADHLVRVGDGGRDFYDGDAARHKILRSKDRCLGRIHADRWNQANFTNLLSNFFSGQVLILSRLRISLILSSTERCFRYSRQIVVGRRLPHEDLACDSFA